MNDRQRILNDEDKEFEIRRLRRQLSPDIVEVLHMLDAFESRSISDAHS
jgi:hypothetical protein